MSAENERRAQTRYSIVLPVKLTITRKGDGVHRVATQNVSAGGALIQTDQTLPLGADVDLTLELPVDQLRDLDTDYINVNITGQVIREDQKGLIIEFDDHCEINRPLPSYPKPGKSLKKEKPPQKPALPFTPRENEILELICAGYSNKEIAKTCDIGLSTVKAHIYNLYKKMGVSSRFQAILWWSAKASELKL